MNPSVNKRIVNYAELSVGSLKLENITAIEYYYSQYDKKIGIPTDVPPFAVALPLASAFVKVINPHDLFFATYPGNNGRKTLYGYVGEIQSDSVSFKIFLLHSDIQ